MRHMDNSVREILHNALQELLEDQFKEFKWRLRNLDHKRKIPAAQLEKADKMDVVDLLCSFYGEDSAGNVCISVLEALHLKGVAGNLRETIWNGASFEREVTHYPKSLRSASKLDYRSTYMDYIKKKFQTMKDGNSLPGESVLLKERFSKLIIVDHRPKEAREHEIVTSGWQHAKIMRNRDSHSITIPTLFKPDKSGLVPDIVVLQGAAGIGKTMTARKIMLDWACGELYQGLFDYVFYIHCREMNLYKEQSSIADLLLKQLPNEDAIRELLSNPQKLLFVIDGFDELRFCIDQPEDHLCNNPWKKQSVTIILSSLFRKKILPESHLLITTRPTALEKLYLLLGRSRYAEILGFSPEDRREYFYKFFSNQDQAEKAFRVVQQNETLFTMCFVPIICWIICTVLKEELDGSEDLVHSSNTITAIYMRYFLSLLKLLKSQGKAVLRTNLRGLCSLAVDGIWKQEILFGEEEMLKYGLDQEDSLPLFLNENIFKRDIECICAYSFIHLSFQEFFAALSYVLEEEEEDALSLQKRNQCVKTLLESYRTSRHDLVLTVRFLFGLLNEEKIIRGLKERLGWKMSQSVKEVLLQWLKNMTKAKIACSFSYKPELFGFLFEIQDEDFLNRSLDHVTEVKLNRIVLTEMEEVILAFCLKNCHHLEVLDAFCCSPALDVFEKDAGRDNQEDNEREELLSSSQLQSYQKSHLARLKLWVTSRVLGSIWRFLAPVEEFLFQWKGLYLFWKGFFLRWKRFFLWPKSSCINRTRSWDVPPGPFQRVCNALASLNSTVTRICFHGCHLTAACGSDLSLVLSNNPTLYKLDLGQNELGDAGMKQLCEGLKHPNCKILELLLHQCHLTSTCCEALSSVFCINQTLIELDLHNNNIGDLGMSLLCEGLKHPNCKLQKLLLDRCGLTAACCQDLSSVLCSNQALAELHLSTNKLKDSGMIILCQGLKHAHSRLRRLLLHWCDLTAVACGDLASVLSTNQNLTKLCLSWNTLGDSGVSRLCEGLRHPDCRLQHLVLTCCDFTAASCADLASVFSNNSSLQVLEFWENHLGDLGVNLLCEGLKHPNCNLQDLTFKRCNITSACCAALASVLMNNPSLKWMHFSEEKLGDAGVSLLCEGLRHPNCKLQKLMFWQCDLTAACCEDLSTVLCSNQSLGELKFWNSKLGNAGVKLLCRALEHPDCKLKELTLSNCELSETSCAHLSSVLSTNKTLTHLKLDYNEILGDSGLKLLCMGLKHPNCRVQKLSLTKCNLTSACCEDLSSLLSTSQTLQALSVDILEMGESEARLLRKGLEDPNCRLQSLMFRFGIVNEKARQELGAVKKTKPDLEIDLW